MTEQDFVSISKAVLLEVVPRLVKEEINKRIPPGMRYHPIYDGPNIIGYHPYIDKHAAKTEDNA